MFAFNTHTTRKTNLTLQNIEVHGLENVSIAVVNNNAQIHLDFECAFFAEAASEYFRRNRVQCTLIDNKVLVWANQFAH